MHAHEDVPPISDLAAHKCDVRLLVDLILECVKAKLPVFGWQLRRGYTLYDRLPTHPVGDQVCDGDQRHVVPTCETTELRHPGHGSILVHDLADDT